MHKDTPDGRIISHCPISPEMEVAENKQYMHKYPRYREKETYARRIAARFANRKKKERVYSKWIRIAIKYMVMAGKHHEYDFLNK